MSFRSITRRIFESHAFFGVLVFLGTWIGLPVGGFLLIAIDSRKACVNREPGDPFDGPAMTMMSVLMIGFMFGPVVGAFLAFFSMLLPRRTDVE